METKILYCQYCEDYICLACNRHIYDSQERVLHDCCEQQIHGKCARLTKQEYKELENKKEEIWYCRTCTKDIFPFHEVNNTQLHKILIKSGRPKNDINKDIAENKSKKKKKKSVMSAIKRIKQLIKPSFPQYIENAAN